jgi:hypothetical protein
MRLNSVVGFSHYITLLLVIFVASISPNTLAESGQAPVELMQKAFNGLDESYQESAAPNPDKAKISQSAIQARALYRQAERLAPNDPAPVFGESLALMQLEEYCKAIGMIIRLRHAGYNGAETSFALGLALIKSSAYGSANFRAGQSYLNNYIALAEKDPNPEINFPNVARAKQVLAGADAQRVADQKKQQRLPYAADGPPKKSEAIREFPFNLSVLSGVGYNDNVISLGKGQPLAPGISKRSAVYNESAVVAGRDWQLSHKSGSSETGWLSDLFSLNYNLTLDAYEGLDKSDRLLQTAFASYQRAFTPTLAGQVKISDQWLYLHGVIASNLFTAQEAFVFSPTKQLRTIASYYFNRVDGFTSTTRFADPDGFFQRAELSQSWILVRDREDSTPLVTISGLYGHEWIMTEGIDGRAQRDELQGKLECNLFHAHNQCSFLRSLTFTTSENWSPFRYSHATFPSETAIDRFKRDDDIHATVLTLSAKMWYDKDVKTQFAPDDNRLEAILLFRYTARDSNVESKTYDQNLCLGTLKVNF